MKPLLHFRFVLIFILVIPAIAEADDLAKVRTSLAKKWSKNNEYFQASFKLIVDEASFRAGGPNAIRALGRCLEFFKAYPLFDHSQPAVKQFFQRIKSVKCRYLKGSEYAGRAAPKLETNTLLLPIQKGVGGYDWVYYSLWRNEALGPQCDPSARRLCRFHNCIQNRRKPGCAGVVCAAWGEYKYTSLKRNKCTFTGDRVVGRSASGRVLCAGRRCSRTKVLGGRKKGAGRFTCTKKQKSTVTKRGQDFCSKVRGERTISRKGGVWTCEVDVCVAGKKTGGQWLDHGKRKCKRCKAGDVPYHGPWFTWDRTGSKRQPPIGLDW